MGSLPKPAAKSAAKRRLSPAERARIAEIFARFEAQESDPRTELDHSSPFTLVVAVALSAQATVEGNIYFNSEALTRREGWQSLQLSNFPLAYCSAPRRDQLQRRHGWRESRHPQFGLEHVPREPGPR